MSMRLRPSSVWLLAFALWTAVLAPCQAQAAPSAEDAKKFEAYKVKAELGDTQAQYNLGNCYATGKGVLKDQLEAYAYWSLAAASKDPKARRSLATLEAEMTMSVRLLGQQRAKELQKDIEDNIAANKSIHRLVRYHVSFHRFDCFYLIWCFFIRKIVTKILIGFRRNFACKPFFRRP